MKKSQKYLIDFQKSHQLKDWLGYFSALTWEKLTKYRKYPAILSLGETCINELFVETIINDILKYNLPIRFFHAKDETANGNDFEIFLPIDDYHYVLFPCQAKKLYKNERYTAIQHPVGEKKREQILYLIDYAKKVNGFPLYFLYNYTPKTFNPKDLKEYLKYEQELFGCTMISAFYLLDNFLQSNQRLKKMTFSDIHPPAAPLTKLADLYKTNYFNNKSILKVFGEVKYKKHQKSLDKMKGYTIAEIVNKKIIDKEWLEIHPKDKKRFVGLQENALKTNLTDNLNYEFNPKYRIVFTTENISVENRLNSFV